MPINVDKLHEFTQLINSTHFAKLLASREEKSKQITTLQAEVAEMDAEIETKIPEPFRPLLLDKAEAVPKKREPKGARGSTDKAGVNLSETNGTANHSPDERAEAAHTGSEEGTVNEAPQTPPEEQEPTAHSDSAEAKKRLKK